MLIRKPSHLKQVSPINNFLKTFELDLLECVFINKRGQDTHLMHLFDARYFLSCCASVDLNS